MKLIVVRITEPVFNGRFGIKVSSDEERDEHRIRIDGVERSFMLDEFEIVAEIDAQDLRE